MSIDPRVLVLEEMRAQTALLRQILAALSGTSQATAAPSADLADLDGPHGDPVVKGKDPRDWSGESMRGRTFSQCPPTYLDLLADRMEFFAGREEDSKKKRYNELDARRARGWAARLRAGWTPPQGVETVTDEAAIYVTSEEPSW